MVAYSIIHSDTQPEMLKRKKREWEAECKKREQIEVMLMCAGDEQKAETKGAT